MVDIATGWVELVAVLGRSYLAHLFRFWQEGVPGLRLSRSRHYHKNDDRFVEQKNGFLVRSLLGYDSNRPSEPDLSESMGLFQFLPAA